MREKYGTMQLQVKTNVRLEDFIMSALSIFFVIFQVLAAVGVVWAMLNEEIFIQMENHLFDRIVAFFKNRRHPEPKQPTVKKVNAVISSDDDEFARFAPFVA